MADPYGGYTLFWEHFYLLVDFCEICTIRVKLKKQTHFVRVLFSIFIFFEKMKKIKTTFSKYI